MDFEWTTENTLKFIKRYQIERILWDPQETQYYDRIAKQKSWDRISEYMGTPTDDIKKKLTSLLASLRRERARMKVKRKRGNKMVLYRSRWFAFKSMSFLFDRNRSLKESESADIKPTLDDDEVDDCLDANTTNDDAETNYRKKTVTPRVPTSQKRSKVPKYISSLNTPTPPTISNSFDQPTAAKRAYIDESNEHALQQDSMLQSAYNILTNAASNANDECGSYCSFVANKMRQYSTKTRCHLQHEISNLLFYADQDNFEEQNLEAQSSIRVSPESEINVKSFIEVSAPRHIHSSDASNSPLRLSNAL